MSTKYIIDVDKFNEEDEVAEAKIYQQFDIDGYEEKKSPKGKPYSFWVSEKSLVEGWDMYFEITRKPKGETITKAINEYIAKNPITKEQKIAYNNKLAKMFAEI